MNRQELAFAGMGETPPSVRAVQRPNLKENLYTGDIPTTFTHVPFVGGEAPKVQNTSLPDIAAAGAYYGGVAANEGINAAQDGLEYLREHGLFFLGTGIGLWALGKIKRTAGWLKYKVGEFFSPYR